MRVFHLLAAGTVLIAALTAGAQQGTIGPSGTDKQEQGRSAKAGVPTAELQLRILTEKLGLTNDQQKRIHPILQDLHDATLRIVEDESLSQDQRLAKVRPLRYEADKKIREVLNGDQQKKLDQYEQGPHPEMHGDLSGASQHQN